MSQSFQNNISGNTVNGKTLFYLEGESGTVVDGGAGQVFLINCDSVTVQNQDITNTDLGIYLEESDYCLIQNNHISSIINLFNDGIMLRDSDYNIISGNNILYNDNGGIRLSDSDFNTITGDTIAFCAGAGIQIDDSNYNIVSWNILTDLDCIASGAIDCSHDSSTTISNNTISQTIHGFGMYLMTSFNNTIENNELSSNQGGGIKLFGGSYCSVEGNTISDNGVMAGGSGRLYSGGVWVGGSNHTISGNTLTGNKNGIYLWEGTSNLITSNTISYSVYSLSGGNGITLDFISDSNTIHGNEISYNDWIGIYSNYCEDNIIYNNDFIGNGYLNALDDGSNFWDNGYPDGGNYWDDHPGPLYDDYNGPDQDIPGSDDIIDLGSPNGGLNPYDVGGLGSAQDNYPFLTPITM